MKVTTKSALSVITIAWKDSYTSIWKNKQFSFHLVTRKVKLFHLISWRNKFPQMESLFRNCPCTKISSLGNEVENLVFYAVYLYEQIDIITKPSSWNLLLKMNKHLKSVITYHKTVAFDAALNNVIFENDAWTFNLKIKLKNSGFLY